MRQMVTDLRTSTRSWIARELAARTGIEVHEEDMPAQEIGHLRIEEEARKDLT